MAESLFQTLVPTSAGFCDRGTELGFTGTQPGRWNPTDGLATRSDHSTYGRTLY